MQSLLKVKGRNWRQSSQWNFWHHWIIESELHFLYLSDLWAEIYKYHPFSPWEISVKMKVQGAKDVSLIEGTISCRWCIVKLSPNVLTHQKWDVVQCLKGGLYCLPWDLIRSGQNWSDPIRSDQNFQIKFASYCQANCSELPELISSVRSKSNQILIRF